MEFSLSQVNPMFLVSFMENLFKNNVLPRGWEPNLFWKSFMEMNNG
jgi:hypothetical protein